MHARAPVLGLVAHNASAATTGLVRACNRLGRPALVVPPERALAELRPGDLALGRLDIRFSLDGIEPGLWELRVLEREGVQVITTASALVATHDKLATAAHLLAAGLPHPDTVHVDAPDALPALRAPLVLKPRFGSWGRDVLPCEDEEAVASSLRALAGRPWFAATGALAQELVPPQGPAGAGPCSR